jgi:hypothetical protein
MARFGPARLVALAAALVMLGLSPASADAALLEASCPGPGTDFLTLPDVRNAQTFTVFHTGTLVRGQLDIRRQDPGGDFQLQILATDGAGFPTNTLLGSATIPDASLGTGVITVAGNFNPPVPVTAGTQYALAITRSTNGQYFMQIRDNNPCPGLWFRSGNTDEPGYDLVFQTFVNPANDFTIGKLKGRKLSLNVPGPGTVSVANVGGGGKSALAAAKKLLKTSTASAAAAGIVKVKLKLTKLASSLIAENGKLKAKAAITFTPTGGEPKTITKKLKLG